MFKSNVTFVAFFVMLLELAMFIVQTVLTGEPSLGTKISLSIFISTLLIVIAIKGDR